MEFWKEKVVQRSCQAEWFSTWPWLHYRASDDVVLCHVCITAMKKKGMEKGNSESSFLFTDFKNWKDGTIAFKGHQASAAHKTVLQWSSIYHLRTLMLINCYLRNMYKTKELTSSVCLFAGFCGRCKRSLKCPSCTYSHFDAVETTTVTVFVSLHSSYV